MVEFTKSGPAWEPEVQQLVAALLPGLTVPVIEIRPEASDRATFTMADLSADGYLPIVDLINSGNTTALFAFQRAFELLGRVHVRLASELDALREFGVPQLTPPDTGELITFLSSVPISSSGAVVARNIIAALEAGPPASWDSARPTLLHGDVHPSNVIVGPQGEVLLLDWGESKIGPAAWDLGLVPRVTVDAYMRGIRQSADSESDIPDEKCFTQEIRWAAALKGGSAVRYLISSDMPHDSQVTALKAMSLAATLAV